jgi:hypothetical protein
MEYYRKWRNVRAMSTANFLSPSPSKITTVNQHQRAKKHSNGMTPHYHPQQQIISPHSAHQNSYYPIHRILTRVACRYMRFVLQSGASPKKLSSLSKSLNLHKRVSTPPLHLLENVYRIFYSTSKRIIKLTSPCHLLPTRLRPHRPL